ncbi:MAG: tyrosine-type recombinase/integrase [Mangrovibacterium sp.]
MGLTASIQIRGEMKDGGLYPLKLRLTQGKKQFYYLIPKEKVNNKLENSYLKKYCYNGAGSFSISRDVFNGYKTAKRGELKDLQLVFNSIEAEALRMAETMNDSFTFHGFKDIWLKTKNGNNRVFALFDETIGELIKEERIGTADSYKIARNSFKKFVGGKDDVSFEYFTVDKLKKYKKWINDNGHSDTSVGMNARALRRVFNIAVGRGITTHYPFSQKKNDGGFKIPKGGGRKIALEKSDLKKIFEYSLPEAHPYSFYFDCWKLIFLLGGINPVDLCQLKEKNIKDDFIFYSRQKTIRTSTEIKTIQVPYTAEVSELFNKWKSEKKCAFLLPIIDGKMDAIKRKAKVAQFVKMINVTMKAVAKELDLLKVPTTYTARHSIATQLLQEGASVKLIGDQLGHTSISTTERYLEGFTDNQINEAYKKVNKF